MLASSSSPWLARHTKTYHHPRRMVISRDGKMYVPSDSFGGLSPEKKASQALETLLTFTAAKIVLAQLEGSGRGALAAYNQEGYSVLSRQLQEVSLKDPDAWLDDLLKKDKGIALRLMEVRAAYATSDFEWDQLQRLSVKAINNSNLSLMRKAATASLQATPTAAAALEATLAAAAAAAAAPAGEAGTAEQQVATAAPAPAPAQQQAQQTNIKQQEAAAQKPKADGVAAAAAAADAVAEAVAEAGAASQHVAAGDSSGASEASAQPAQEPTRQQEHQEEQ